MSVGAGSIRRAASTQTVATVKVSEPVKEVKVIETPAEKPAEKEPVKKQPSKKTSTAPRTKKEASPEKLGQRSYRVTEELPVYLL